jgi:hypothetical protein
LAKQGLVCSPRYIIANGVDVNRQITDGKAAGVTPLDLARGCGEDEVTEMLEQHGALTKEKLAGQPNPEKSRA